MATGGATTDRAAKNTARSAKNMRRDEVIKRVAACFCLLGVLATILFYSSYPGLWGLHKNDWYAIFGLANNLISLSVIVILFTNPTHNEKIIIGWVLLPYYVLKCLYLIAAHWDVNIISEGKWHDVWVIILPVCFLISLIHSLYLRYANKED